MKFPARENKKIFLNANFVPKDFHIRQICGDTVENNTKTDKPFSVNKLKCVYFRCDYCVIFVFQKTFGGELWW